MIDRFLRRLSVRQRIVGGFVILVVLMMLFAPLIIATRGFIVGRLEQITGVDTRTDRLLLLASARVESSRVNLMRYMQDYAPSAYEALDDTNQAIDLLIEARGLITVPDQQEAVDTVLAALDDYKVLIGEVETTRAAGQEQDVSRLLFQSSRLGNDIGARIEQVVADSEARLEAANREFFTVLQNRMLLLAAVFVVVLSLALVLSIVIERSITQPVAQLTERADAFRQGDLDATVPVVGSDELSLLAQTFNEMTAQLQSLIGTLEQRVAERTQDLESRAVQLATAADVGRAAASVLDLETLTHRVVDLVRDRFDLYYAGLFLIGQAGQYAMLRAGTGKAGGIMEEQGHKLALDSTSMVGLACTTRQPRIALDVGDEPARFDNPLLPETRSELALPLIAGNRVLGALDVQSTEPGAFSVDEIAVLQLVADQAAVAIQNARLFAEVETMLETERRVYGEISREAWAQVLRTRSALGYYGDEQGLTPVGEVWPLLMETALQKGRTIAEQDDEPGLALPIVVRDQVIGAIDARKPGEAGGWTQQEITLLETLVDQLGSALDSARLYEDTQRRAARDRLLGEVAARVRESLDVESVLRTTAQEVREALDLPEVSVRLRTSRTGAEIPGSNSEQGDG